MKKKHPKFPKVNINDLSPKLSSLVADEGLQHLFAEEAERIKTSLVTAMMRRVEILFEHYDLQFGQWQQLAFKLAIDHVPNFEVRAGSSVKKSGPQKRAVRFETVTAVERASRHHNVTIAEGIRIASSSKVAGRSFILSPDSLRTKYYEYLREIEAVPEAVALLRLWRKEPIVDGSEFISLMFWTCESQFLSAKQPHNVQRIKG